MTELGEIVKATLSYAIPNASEAQNVFHWILAEATTTDADILEEIIRWSTDDWGDKWADLGSTSSTLVDVKADIVNVDGTVDRALGQAVLAIVGTQVGGGVSAAVAAYLLLKTVRPKVRGTKYVPGMGDGVVDDGEIDAGGLADMAFLLIDYGRTLNPAIAGALIPGVASKSLGVFEPFLDTGIIESIPAYQRRRKPNVGS